MDLHHLRVFQAAARTGSFTAAGRDLLLSPGRGYRLAENVHLVPTGPWKDREGIPGSPTKRPSLSLTQVNCKKRGFRLSAP
jgi:hypothetical protein